MKRLLVLLLLVAGCRTWDVRAFGVPVGKEPKYMQASSDLTTDEKVGVVVVLAAMVGVGVAVALAAD